MSWTTPRTFVAGETETAAIFNAHLRDNLNAIATVQSYAPTIGGTAWVVGNGTLTAKHFSYGNREFVTIHFVLGTTSVGGSGALTWTLPTSPAINGSGTAIFIKGSNGFAGFCKANAGGVLNVYYIASAAGAIAGVVNGQPSAGNWTTGDVIDCQVEYTV